MKFLLGVITTLLMYFTFLLTGSAQISPITGLGRLTDETGGYSFAAPAEWKSTRQTGGYSLTNAANTILILVKPHEYASFEAAVKDMNLNDNSRVLGEPQDLRDGGKAVRIAHQTANGIAIIDLFVLFSPSGGGAVVIAMTDSARADSAFQSAARIAASLTFVKREQSFSAASPWRTALAGKHLLYLFSGNGYFEEKHIYLCSSGVFLQKTGSGGFSPGDADGGSFAGKGGTRGTWRIEGATLIMNFPDGSIGRLAITQRQARNEVGLNGRRYFVQTQNVCP